MIIFLVIFLSFVFEYFINGFFHGTIFSGLIIFSSLILLEPFFKKNRDRYYVFCFLIGFLYDLVYSGTYFLNAGLFLFIGIIVSFINHITPNNLIVSILQLVFLIGLYRTLCFLFMVINGFIGFDFSILFESIYSSIIINVIYGIILYFVLYLISLKFKIRRIK